MATAQLSIENKLLVEGKSIELIGINHSQWTILLKYFFSNKLTDKYKKSLYLCANPEEAEALYESLKDTRNCFFFPGIGSEIYYSIIPSEFNFIKKFILLNFLVNESPKEICIISTIEAAMLYLPDKCFF